MTARYVIGIDLGTTNSVLAYAPLDAEPGAEPQLELLHIPQLVAAGTTESRTSLPSFMYLATPDEANSAALALPWQQENPVAVGEWARRRGRRPR